MSQAHADAFDIIAKASGQADERIDMGDLRAAYKQMDQTPSDPQLSLMMEEADMNRDGYVDKKEFLQFMSRKVPGMDSPADIQNAFRIMAEYDVPGRTFAKVDGKISSEKLAWIMQNVAELDGEEVANIVKDAQADSTGGVIDYAAFGARFFAPVADP